MISGVEPRLRRAGPLVAGIISPLVIWWVWGQIVPVAVIHDEASYLLQTEIFAAGRWTAPSPPIPEFFEQPHVQLVPALASKYPPGHALLLMPGALLGFPPLVPLVLTALTAALMFALVARVTNPWVALVAWPVWLFAPMVLRFQPSYLSQLTTTALVLGSWWSLASWRETRRRRWLVILALCVGWGAITRPLTMLMFAIPIGVVVIRDVARDRRWGDLGVAVALGIAILAILPVWSARTTGSWRVSPIAKHRVDYLPFDKLGFTADTTRPQRHAEMSRAQVETYRFFLYAKQRQSFAALPVTTARRALAVATGLFQGWRLPLLVAALVGLFLAPQPLRFAAFSAGLLFVAHLPYAHTAQWTVYYLEATPVAAALAALGFWHTARRFAQARAPVIAGAVTALIALGGLREARATRARLLGLTEVRLQRQLVELLPTLSSPGIVFVRNSPRLRSDLDIVRNSAHLDREPIWVVHDLGPRNEELRGVAPHRATYVLDLDELVRQPPSANDGAR